MILALLGSHATARPPEPRLVARGRAACLVGIAIVVAGCALAPATPAPGASAPGASGGQASPTRGFVPSGPTETATVVRVVDGDTVIIDRGRGRERLRYVGINAPESVTPDTPVGFMGKEAAAENAALVDGRDVVLERDVSDVDQYGRLLRYVWLRDGSSWVFVNLELVRGGFAQAVTFPPDVRWADVLRQAERDARAADAGLWGDPTPGP